MSGAGRTEWRPGNEVVVGWAVLPASEAGPDDISLVFGARGAAHTCNCQRYKLAPKESFGSLGIEELAHRLRGQSADEPGPGLVGYADGDPIAWCAVEPRSEYAGLARSFKVPWLGRDENRLDPSVWAITCFTTRAGHRRSGHASRLVVAAVAHARAHGAKAVEGYPILTTAVLAEELHVGTLGMFLRAGFTEVNRPTLRRAVVRIDF